MREVNYLKMRYRVMLYYTGFILILCGIIMLSPLLTLFAWPHESPYAWGFLIPAFIMMSLGITGRIFFSPENDVPLTKQEGGVIVLISWILVCLFSSIPFMLVADLNFTQAFFESVSGWTTTGLSVIDITQSSHLILLWRSIMQLAGGAGLAIIMLSAIIGMAGPAVSQAEGREQLVPHVRQSAKLVLIIYACYNIAGIIALNWAGMNFFDSVNHAFAALSTGGFSTRAESIGYWDSVSIEAVLIPMMLLGNLSFITAWLIIRGNFRAARQNGEIILSAFMLPVSLILILFFTAANLYPNLSKAIRVAVFEVVTASTTTGFSTVSYGNWNAFGWVILITLMVIGGGTCSTAGGIKQYRIYLLWKSLWWELRQNFLPRTSVTQNSIWEADHQVFVKDSSLRRVGNFLFLYILTLALGTGILTAHGYGFKESLFEYASALGTVGLSVGITSNSAPSGVLWAEIAGMLLGRLEFLVIFISSIKIIQDAGKFFRAYFFNSGK